jgi:hypothetical protein
LTKKTSNHTKNYNDFSEVFDKASKDAKFQSIIDDFIDIDVRNRVAYIGDYDVTVNDIDGLQDKAIEVINYFLNKVAGTYIDLSWHKKPWYYRPAEGRSNIEHKYEPTEKELFDNTKSSDLGIYVAWCFKPVYRKPSIVYLADRKKAISKIIEVLAYFAKSVPNSEYAKKLLINLDVNENEIDTECKKLDSINRKKGEITKNKKLAKKNAIKMIEADRAAEMYD